MEFVNAVQNFPFLLHHIPEFTANFLPDKTAISFSNYSITYREFDRHVKKVASYLISNGFRKNDKIILFLPNSPDFIFSLMAVWKIGAVAVPIYPNMSAFEFGQILSSFNATGLIVAPSRYKKVQKELGNYRSLKILLLDDAREGAFFLHQSDYLEEFHFEAPPVIDLDPALIIFTSGSTGMPKGIMLSHKSILTNCLSNIRVMKFNEQDRTLIQMPMTYLYALVHQVLCTFFTGGTIHILSQLFLPHLFLQEIELNKITWFAGTPAIYYSIARYLGTSASKTFTTVRLITIGGGRIHHKTLKRLKPIFPKAKIAITYGLTENSPRVCTYFYSNGEYMDGNVGYPLPNIDLQVEPNKNAEEGEVVIRGGSLMMGYVSGGSVNPVDNRDYFPTGDLGYFDKKNRLIITGRIKHMINNSGYKVNPGEIERVIMSHPSVSNVLVYGVEDIVYGEIVKAEIIPEEGCRLSKNDIWEYCKRYLSPYKIPKIIKFKKNIDFNQNMKFVYKKLEEIRYEDIY